MPSVSERVGLGNTGVSFTRMGLGTAPLGGLFTPVTTEDALQTISTAWSLGLRYFDTAPLYGYGLAETRLGQALTRHARSEFTLSTKVGRLIRSGIPRHPLELDPNGELFYKGAPEDLRLLHDFSYDGVLRSMEESLQRLGLDRVDLAFIHDPDAVELDPTEDGHVRKIMEGAYRALARLREQGVIKAIGVGMNQVEMLVRFARAGDFDAFLVAGRYTLLDQAALRELFPLCLEKGIRIIIGGVYNSGILANPQPGATFDYLAAPAELVEKARRMHEVCQRHGVPLKAAAIQFPLGHPAVLSVLSGARRPEEIQENVRMFETPIPHQLWEELLAEGLLPEGTPIPRQEGVAS